MISNMKKHSENNVNIKGELRLVFSVIDVELVTHNTVNIVNISL